MAKLAMAGLRAYFPTNLGGTRDTRLVKDRFGLPAIARSFFPPAMGKCGLAARARVHYRLWMGEIPVRGGRRYAARDDERIDRPTRKPLRLRDMRRDDRRGSAGTVPDEPR